MTIPSVDITKVDGGLGALPASADGVLAVIGTSSAGAVALPSAFGRKGGLSTGFGIGPGVEAAALHIERTGRAAIFVRAETVTAGAAGTIAQTNAGTSDVTVSSEPLDDYEVRVTVENGGTLGAAGIVLTWSLDDGRNVSQPSALGTALTFTIPDSGVVLTFETAKTLLTGDVITFNTTAPKSSGEKITAAIEALKNSVLRWELCLVVDGIDSTMFDAVDAGFLGMFNRGKFKPWFGNTRLPTAGETSAAYLASLTTALGSKATTMGAVGAGACEVPSAISGRSYRRPISFIAASNEAIRSEEVNTADINLGALSGVSLRDSLGNPKHHDETVYPGLDDARFYVLRTWDEEPEGVYVNQPRLFSPAGSDFELIPHARVYNLGMSVLARYFKRRLNKKVFVDKKTGFLLEQERVEIQLGADEAMKAALTSVGKASATSVILSAYDNVLSTRTITVEAWIVPVAYPRRVNIMSGFRNPAMLLQAA